MDDEDLDLLEVGELELVGDELDELLSMVSGEDDDDYEDDDELGAYLDDDDDEEVGARRRRGRRRRRRSGRGRRGRVLRQAIQRAARKRRVMRGGRQVVAASKQKGRVLLLGGEATQGATAGQLLVPTTVQELARVDRLFITATNTAGVVLNPASYAIADIKVGTQSQFAGLPPLPGIMFSADATSQGRGLQLDTVQPGTNFTVIVANAPGGSRFNWGAYATAMR